MINKIYFIIFFLFLGNNIFSQQDDTEENSSNVKEEKMDIVLGMDQLKTLDFVPAQQISLSNDEGITYDLFPSRKEIVFKGRRPDTSTVVTIRDTTGEVRLRITISVVRSNLSDKLSQIKAFLGDVEGLDVGIKGNYIYLGGEIVLPEDLGKISTILALFPQDVVQLFELSPRTQETIAQRMQDEFRKFGLKDLSVRVVNKAFWLEGVVNSDAEKQTALNIVTALIPDRVQSLAANSERIERPKQRDTILDFIKITPPKQNPPPPDKMVKIMAQFVELTKDYNRVFGFKWMPTLSTGGGSIQFGRTTQDGVTTKSDGTFSGTISNLFPQLSAARNAGYARIVESGIIIGLNNQTASLNKTTTIPFVIGSGNGQRILQLRPTFALTIKPSILASEKDKISLAPVNFTVTIAAGNQNMSNTINTGLIVGSKETAVLGGVVINEALTYYDKDPAGGDQKVDANTGVTLLSIIKSKANVLSKNQFVAFITPEIIESASQGTEEIKQKFRQRRQ